jgi:hypothetical protein
LSLLKGWDIMKRSFKSISILVVLGIAAGLAVVMLAGKRIMHVERYSVSFDPLLADKICSEIQHAITALTLNNQPALPILCTELAKRFTCIKTVTAQRCAPNVVHIDVSAVQPALALTPTTIMSDDGVLVSKNCFAPYRVCYLRGMQMQEVPKQGAVSQDLKAYIAELVCLSKYYNVTWINALEIHLDDKEQPAFSIICNAEMLKNAALFKRCQELKANLYTQGVSEANLRKHIVADVRFAKQIVVYADKRG